MTHKRVTGTYNPDRFLHYGASSRAPLDLIRTLRETL